MSGYYAHGRLQDAEWLMRACMILNRDRPAHADPVDEDTPLNQVYARQSAEFEDLLAQIDPEGDIDRGIFPVLAFFTASEGWPAPPGAARAMISSCSIRSNMRAS